MAAGTLAPPGTDAGPCKGSCYHRDCDFTRKLANTACVHCGKPIGYEVNFFHVEAVGDPAWSKLAHASCEYAAIDI